ncbi:hypothetical protein LCGC14_3167070, partial [marine sediment metagenome]
RAVNREVGTEGPKIVGVDVSREGDDETVIACRKGMKTTDLITWGHQDTIFSASRVKNFCEKSKVDILRVDSIGVGGPVVDDLRAWGVTAEQINVGLPAIDKEHFLNIRAEGYQHLADLFTNDEISIPEDEDLKAQLCDIRYEYNDKGIKKIESKKDSKSRGSKSPDKADALMMAFLPGYNQAQSQPVDNN